MADNSDFLTRNYNSKWKFRVDIAGIDAVAKLPVSFQKCSGLEMEVAVAEYYEGGSAFANKSPGRAKVGDITLERGSCSDDTLWKWFNSVVNAATAGLGTVVKGEVTITEQDLAGNPSKRWLVHGAWPTKFVPGDLDNTSDDKIIQTLTLACDRFELDESLSPSSN